MTSKESIDYYNQFKTYETKPIVSHPLLDSISKEALIAWFRCNSCTSCKWREEVIDKDADINHDIHFCSRLHRDHNHIDMVSYLGYSKEGLDNMNTPRFAEVSDVK